MLPCVDIYLPFFSLFFYQAYHIQSMNIFERYSLYVYTWLSAVWKTISGLLLDLLSTYCVTSSKFHPFCRSKLWWFCSQIILFLTSQIFSGLLSSREIISKGDFLLPRFTLLKLLLFLHHFSYTLVSLSNLDNVESCRSCKSTLWGCVHFTCTLDVSTCDKHHRNYLFYSRLVRIRMYSY